MAKICFRPGLPVPPIRRTLKSVPLIFAGLLASCADLPDLSGYTAATQQVKQSVAAAGDAVGSEIRAFNTTLADDDVRKGQLKAAITSFDDSWKITVGSLDAMVKYAESLEAISDAGNKGAESAGKLANSLEELAAGIGLKPAGPIVGVTAETLAFIYGQIAKVRAAKSLATALDTSGPVIQQIGELVAKQVGSAGNALRISIAAQRQFLISSSEGSVVARDQDIAKIEALLLNELGTELQKTSPNEVRIKQIRTQLETYAGARKSFKPLVETYQSRLADIETRGKNATRLLGSARSTLQSWSDAHADLVTAIRTRRPVTLTSLLAAVKEARAIIQKWEDL